MNSTEIFTLALGLQEPWEITDVEMNTDDGSLKELHLHMGFKSGSKFEDNEGNQCSVYDTKEKTWRHTNFFEHRCMIHCSVPRIKTSAGKVRMVEVPRARKGSGFTLLFEAIAMSLIEKEMPVNKVSD